jgi:sRNA-binding regulator protein Hfq
MNNNDALLGKHVALYLEGGWELSGEISLVKEDRILIKNKEDVFLVFRDKVSAMHINAKNNIDVKHRGRTIPVSSLKSTKEGEENHEVNNPGEYDYGPSIPIDMLTEEAQTSIEDDDYSVFFGASGNNEEHSRTGMTFSLDDNNDNTEK